MKTIISILSLIMLIAVCSGITAIASTTYGYNWNPSYPASGHSGRAGWLNDQARGLVAAPDVSSTQPPLLLAIQSR